MKLGIKPRAGSSQVKMEEETPEIQSNREPQTDFTETVTQESKMSSPNSEERKKKEYVKQQIKKRTQARILERMRKQEEEQAKRQRLKELKEKQLRLVQNNIKKARLKQKQQQEQQPQQHGEEIVQSEINTQDGDNLNNFERWLEDLKETRPKKIINDTTCNERNKSLDINDSLRNVVETARKDLHELSQQLYKIEELKKGTHLHHENLKHEATTLVTRDDLRNIIEQFQRVKKKTDTYQDQQWQNLNYQCFPSNISDKDFASQLPPNESLLPQTSSYPHSRGTQTSEVRRKISKALKGINLEDSNSATRISQVTNDIQLKGSYDIKRQDGFSKHNIIVRKKVSKALKEIIETGKKQELAATKIQAAFRGYQTRKLRNIEAESPSEYIFFKGMKDLNEAESSNRPTQLKRSVQSSSNVRSEKAAKFPTFSSTSVNDGFTEWLKPSYVRPCSYNIMTAIQNTMLSRSSPRQQANRTPVSRHSKKEQAVPVIDASKGKAKKRLSSQQLIHSSKMNRKEYESSVASDEDSMQGDFSMQEEDHNSSSDDSRVRWKRRLNLKSPEDVLPSRVKPVYWSKSDSEIIVRNSSPPKSRIKLYHNNGKENLEKNVRMSVSSISQGKPAIMPKRGKYSRYGLIAPNVELRRKTGRLSEMRTDAENSGTDTWNSHTVDRQHTSSAPDTASKLHSEGHSAEDPKEFIRNAMGVCSGDATLVDDGRKEKMLTNDNERIREQIKARTGSASSFGMTSFAAAVESGVKFHPSALHLQFQAELSRMESLQEYIQHLTEVEAIVTRSRQVISKSTSSQTLDRFDVPAEEKQVQVAPVAQTLTSNVQTQTLVQDDSIQHKSTNKTTHRTSYSNSATRQDLEMKVESSQLEPQIIVQKINSNQSVQQPSSTQPKILIQLLPSNHQFENIPQAVSQTTATTMLPQKTEEIQVPSTSTLQAKSDLNLHANHSQTPVLVKTKSDVKIIDNSMKLITSKPAENNVATDRVSDHAEDAGQPIAVDQLLQASKHTRRLIDIEDKEAHEALKRRREELMEELSGRCRKWDVKHKEFMNKIEREDSEHLKQILLGNIGLTSMKKEFFIPAQLHRQVDVVDISHHSNLNAQNTEPQSSGVLEGRKNEQQVGASFCSADVLNSSAHQHLLTNVNYKRGAVEEVFSNIGKNVMDLEKTVTENIEDTTPELSFRTISEVISDEDTGTSTSSLRAENKEIQDVNGTLTSYRSDISTSKLNESEKLSRVKELLIKIDKLIEEKESVQSHMNLLNEKFKLLKKRAKADMKYIQMRIRSHTEKGEVYLVPPLKKKQMSLVKNLEQARVENKGEYEKLVKEKVKIKQTLQQQKALIMSYLKSLQFRGRNLQEDHRSRSSLSDDDKRSISSNSATHVDLPSAPPSVEDEERPSSHGSEPSDNSGIVPIGNQEGSSKEVVTLLDTSSKQEQISIDKFNNSEAVTEYTPPTEAETDISDLGRRVRGLHEQLRKKKQKAEKLSREYRMKKKQQLRNEEQILLKQLQEYDAYINKTRKELEDCRDNLTGTSLLSDKLLQEDKIQLPLFRDTTKHPSKKKLLKQEEIRQEEDNSMSEQSTILQSSGTVESSHQISPKNITSKTSTLKDQLKESLDVSSSRAVDPELKAQNDISENLDIKTALRSFITSGDNARQQSIPVEEDLEEVSEELEEVIEQVEDISENLEVQTDIEDERQWTSNSTVHTQNDESTINELLDKSDSVIQEVLMEELESESVIEESIGIKLRSEVTEEMHTENPESSVHELLDQSDSVIEEALVEKLESGSVIEELDEEKSNLQCDMQELTERKHNLASDIQDIIEEKYDTASASGKSDSESVIQEYLDKFESDIATHDTLYSTQEPSINNERPVSRSFVQELVVSKEKSTIEEQGESVDEVESIPEEEEEDESDIVTRIEEKDVRSSFEQNLKDGEQYSSSFIDQTEEKVAASGTMNLLEDAVHDSVHDVLKHEETENDKKDVDEGREEIHQHEIRNLEEFHVVKESESLSVASEISETSFEKESEENVHNRDIVKSKEKNDEELSKKVERITDMIFQNLLKESLEKFETKNSEVNNRREFSDQLIGSTEDSEVRDRSEFGDQLIESTKNSEIHDKSEVYDKNESGSHIIESTKDCEVHDRSEFGSQMIESTKDSVHDKSEFGSQLIESTKDSEVHDKSEFGEELIESKKDSEVYDETESGGHLIENTKDSEVQERSEFGSLLVESTKDSEVHDKSEFGNELIEIENNSEVYDKNEPGSQLIGSTKDSEVHDKSEFDDELLETRKDSEVFNKNDSGGQLIESGESSEVHEENEFREQVIKSTENKVVLSETQDKTVNRVDNITNSILEQLLIESSLLLCSKKTTYVSTSKENDLSAEGKNEEVAAVGEVVAIGSPILTSEQSDRNGVNVRKRVSEILAESSGSLSSAKEKTRPQDFMITTYDVLSPEETPSHTPQPGSPSREIQDKTMGMSAVSQELEEQQTVALGLSASGYLDGNGVDGSSQEWFDEDFGLSHTRRVAEELRLQQLQIEQEILELEQAQEQLPYFYIREIPNKPPPPYTPPNQQARTQTAASSGSLSIPAIKQDVPEEEPRFIPSSVDELHSLTVEVVCYLCDALATGGNLECVEPPPDYFDDPDAVNLPDVKKSSKKIFKKLIFDLTTDLVKEAYDCGREKPCAPWDWPAFSHKRRKLPLKSKEMLQEMVTKQVISLFGFAPKTYKEKLVIRWSRKKRDYVDEILMKESHEEESAWTNYDEDEVTVKNEIAVGIVDSLLDETLQLFLAIRDKKVRQ
ncbi:uncharacterized protein [Periplaneta americana]